MLQEKHLIDSWRAEMTVMRDDIITLFKYLHVPYPLHVSECNDLVECVSRLSNEFDVPRGQESIADLLDEEIIEGVSGLNRWHAIENSM